MFYKNKHNDRVRVEFFLVLTHPGRPGYGPLSAGLLFMSELFISVAYLGEGWWG